MILGSCLHNLLPLHPHYNRNIVGGINPGPVGRLQTSRYNFMYDLPTVARFFRSHIPSMLMNFMYDLPTVSRFFHPHIPSMLMNAICCHGVLR